MKMVVLEAKGKYAAALTENGDVVKIINSGYRAGEEIHLVKRPEHKMPVAVKSIIAAAAAFIVIFTAGVVATELPMSYVSVDVNPSIEYELNLFNEVVKVKALNDDAQKILSELELRKQKADEAMGMVIEEMNGQGYFGAQKNERIVISAAGYDDGKSKEILDRVVQKTAQKAKESGIHGEIIGIQADMNDVKEATKYSTTAGKYKVAKTIVESSAGQSIEDCEKAIQDLVNTPIQETAQMFEGNASVTVSSELSDENSGLDVIVVTKPDGSQTDVNTAAPDNLTDEAVSKDNSDNVSGGSSQASDSNSQSSSSQTSSQEQSSSSSQTSSESSQSKPKPPVIDPSQDDGSGNLDKDNANSNPVDKDKGSSSSGDGQSSSEAQIPDIDPSEDDSQQPIDKENANSNPVDPNGSSSQSQNQNEADQNGSSETVDSDVRTNDKTE